MWVSRFCFINPTKIGPEYTQQSQYIGQTFIERDQPNTLFITIQHRGSLDVGCCQSHTEIVYYLDSLGVNIGQRQQLRRMFDNAIKIYRANKGTKVSKVKFSNIKWTMIKVVHKDLNQLYNGK
ncbi:hypothetical protein SESBI_48689 [Sesbania bispinosa]|nr:hypothetical protein SESBI_48689 [Sesbania bispinosa]